MEVQPSIKSGKFTIQKRENEQLYYAALNPATIPLDSTLFDRVEQVVLKTFEESDIVHKICLR